MTLRTFVDKNGNEWNWEETSAVVEAVKYLTEFDSNYEGPLYVPHSELKDGKETD